ncbi:MAG: hypothetical protein SVK08_06105, partial [Halobacteriota archaeon]|nr:hypothetical protein [Halobacteriota archaeon]
MNLKKINWMGIFAGILAISIPFLGPWWEFTLGTDAIFMAVSPFGVEMSMMGLPEMEEAFGSPLFSWLLLSIKLGIIYTGSLLLLGSILSASENHSSLSDIFIRFSSRKILFLVVGFLIMILIGTIIINLVPDFMGSGVDSELPVKTDLPYLVGSGEISAEIESSVRLTGP